MKINPPLSQFTAKLPQISLLTILFLTLFTAPSLAIDIQAKQQEDRLLNSNSSIIARKKVRTDRSGRRYVLNRFRQRVYLYPKSPKNHNFKSKIKLDRNGRRYILKPNGQKFYL